MKEELLQLTDQMRDNEKDGKKPFFRKLLAKDFILRRADKSVITRDGLLEDIRERKYKKLDTRDVEVFMSTEASDYAVVQLTVDAEFIDRGEGRKKDSGKFRHIRFFRKSSKGWKLYAWFEEEMTSNTR